MRTIPHRELRNNSAAILRAAERGEEFVVTVDGRPVAVVGPYRKRQWVRRDDVTALLRTPTDPTVLDDLREGTEDAIRDPWAS